MEILEEEQRLLFLSPTLAHAYCIKAEREAENIQSS